MEGGSSYWQASEVISMSDTSPVPRFGDDLHVILLQSSEAKSHLMLGRGSYQKMV
jgi:hypothetical protein